MPCARDRGGGEGGGEGGGGRNEPTWRKKRRPLRLQNVGAALRCACGCTIDAMRSSRSILVCRCCFRNLQTLVSSSQVLLGPDSRRLELSPTLQHRLRLEDTDRHCTGGMNKHAAVIKGPSRPQRESHALSIRALDGCISEEKKLRDVRRSEEASGVWKFRGPFRLSRWGTRAAGDPLHGADAMREFILLSKPANVGTNRPVALRNRTNNSVPGPSTAPSLLLSWLRTGK